MQSNIDTLQKITVANQQKFLKVARPKTNKVQMHNVNKQYCCYTQWMLAEKEWHNKI